MLQFDGFQELQNMPGVFQFTWDNCKFDAPYKYTQVMVTNAPFLTPLARDCDHAVGRHFTVGRDGKLITWEMEQYTKPWVSEFAVLLHNFVAMPNERCDT